MNIFNTPQEVGTRALLILSKVEASLSVDSLVILDYLLLHSRDFPGGPLSVHAEIPYRKGELVVKRRVIQKGVDLFLKKGIVEKQFKEDGIFYSSNELTPLFLKHFKSEYFRKLCTISSWISENIPFEDEIKLKRLVYSKIGMTESEFVRSES